VTILPAHIAIVAPDGCHFLFVGCCAVGRVVRDAFVVALYFNQLVLPAICVGPAPSLCFATFSN